GALDPDFARRTDLRLYGVGFVATWMVVFRLFGGGDLASPRFGRRTLAAVARTALATSVVLVVVFFFAPFFAPRGATLLTVPLVGAATLAWRYGYLRFLRSQVLAGRVA